MSRIGNKPITVPEGVEVKIDGQNLTVKGPKGTLTREIHKNMKVNLEGNVLTVVRPNDEPANRSLHGLTRTLINNMIIGVTHEYTKELQINGVGYRVAKQGTGINMTLGYSHPVIMEAPEGITFDVPNANTIIVTEIAKISRNSVDAYTKVGMINEAGGTVVSVMEGILELPIRKR